MCFSSHSQRSSTNRNQGPELSVYKAIHLSRAPCSVSSEVTSCVSLFIESLRVLQWSEHCEIILHFQFCDQRRNESHMVWSDVIKSASQKHPLGFFSVCCEGHFSERCVIDIISAWAGLGFLHAALILADCVITGSRARVTLRLDVDLIPHRIREILRPPGATNARRVEAKHHVTSWPHAVLKEEF